MRSCSLVLLLLLAGCGASPSPSPSPGPIPSAMPGGKCLTGPERAGLVRLRSDNGASLAGVLLGGGRTGVVLAHSNNTDLCDWVPYARVLAGLGYLAFSIDL